MGLFNLFGKKEECIIEKEIINVFWLKFSRLEQLDEIVEILKIIFVVIFKYFIICGISRMVIRNFENDYVILEDKLKLYYLDLFVFRDVFNEVGYKFQVIY